MADQSRQAGRGGVGMSSDPKGSTPRPDPAPENDPGVGEMGIPLPIGDKPDPRGGTIDPDFEDITEPTGDANFPDPSKPISMIDRPDRGQGGYGDSRGNVSAPDESKSETDMARDGADRDDYPDVSQPANVEQDAAIGPDFGRLGTVRNREECVAC